MLHRIVGVCCVAFFFALVAASGGDAKKNADFKPGSYSGTWFKDKVTLTFDEKGKFSITLTEPEALLVKGSAKVTKDEIEFTDEEGTLKAEGTGKYKWKLEEQKLTFTKVEDKSEGRTKGLTGTTWVLTK